MREMLTTDRISAQVDLVGEKNANFCIVHLCPRTALEREKGCKYKRTTMFRKEKPVP